MKRAFKWIGFTLLGLVFLAALVSAIAYYYRDEIFAAVNQEIRKNINGDVNIGSFDFGIWQEFPEMSITLGDIYVRGPQYDQFRHDFLNAKKVDIKVQLAPLFHKTLVVRSVKVTHGTLFIFRTKSGYTNVDVLKRQQPRDSVTTTDPFLVLFNKVGMEDVTVSYQDSLKKKSFAFHFIDVENTITQKDSSQVYQLAGQIKFNGLMFNSDNGSFLEDRSARVLFNLEYRQNPQTLFIHPSSMEFSNSKVDLLGEFDFTAPGKFKLKIGSDKIDFPEGTSLLTRSLQRKLEKFEIEKPVKVTTTLEGGLAAGSRPFVDVSFQIVDSNIRGYKIEADKVTTDGAFSNHVDGSKPVDDVNSWIKFNNLEGLFQGLPTKLTATISDLNDPVVNLESIISTDLRYLNTRIDTQSVKILKGTFDSHINFSGKLNEYLDSTKTKFRGKLSGTAGINGGAVSYVSRNQIYEDIKVAVEFTQDHLKAHEISFLLNKSAVKINGEGNGFIPFFSQPEKKGYVRLEVYSPDFNFASIVAKKTRKATVREKAMAKKKLSGLIDKLYDKIAFDLTVKLDQLSLDNLRGSRMKGQIVLSNNTLEARNFTMDLGGGNISFSFSLANLNKPINPIFLSATVHNTDIKTFLYSFNNFGVTSPTHENLSGRINMRGKFWAAVDDDFRLWVPSLAGNVEVNVRNGRLQNFEPLQNMSNFLFKRRDFNNVQFGEIKTRFRVRGTEIDIAKMEIESTVLRLFLEGRYSLKDSTNLELQIPLSNLKRRDKTYRPENVGIDTKVGPSVFLHVYKDLKGKTVIAYDPFKKHVKKKIQNSKSKVRN